MRHFLRDGIARIGGSMSYEYTPHPRLRDYTVGDTIRLVGITRQLTITAIRSDGYFDLEPGVTACAWHLVEIEK